MKREKEKSEGKRSLNEEEIRPKRITD